MDLPEVPRKSPTGAEQNGLPHGLSAGDGVLLRGTAEELIRIDRIDGRSEVNTLILTLDTRGDEYRVAGHDPPAEPVTPRREGKTRYDRHHVKGRLGELVNEVIQLTSDEIG